MTALGFILFILGASAMDSSSLIVPVMMIVAGMAMLYVGQKGRKYDSELGTGNKGSR